MNRNNAERWIVASAFGAIVFGGAAAALERPWPTGDAAQFATFLAENRGAILAQSFLFIVGGGFYLWFLGGLRTFLRRDQAATGSISSVAFGAGLVWCALNIIGQAPQIMLTLPSQSGVSHDLATVMADLCFVTLNIANFPLAVMFSAIAIAILRTRVLPAWLGWLAAVNAAAALLLTFAVAQATGPLAPQGWLTLVLYPMPVIWLVPAAIVMIRRPGRDHGVSGSSLFPNRIASLDHGAGA